MQEPKDSPSNIILWKWLSWQISDLGIKSTVHSKWKSRSDLSDFGTLTNSFLTLWYKPRRILCRTSMIFTSFNMFDILVMSRLQLIYSVRAFHFCNTSRAGGALCRLLAREHGGLFTAFLIFHKFGTFLWGDFPRCNSFIGNDTRLVINCQWLVPLLFQ